MLVGKEESVGPISAALSHRYCAKKFDVPIGRPD